MNDASNQPFLSVCCITYNHVNFIKKALNGFLMQETSFPFEIIVHDDCSTDGTTDIIREYERQYPQLIKPIYQSENQFSKGIKIFTAYVWPKTRGKYIALCEGDDYWIDPLKLQKQADYLDNNPDCALSFHNALTFDDNNQKFVGVLGPDEIKDKYQLIDLFIENFIPTCSVMYRNGLIKEFPDWFLHAPVGDLPMHILHAQHGAIGYINEVMGVYRIHPGGRWTGLDDISRSLNFIILLDLFAGFLPQYTDLIQEQIEFRWGVLIPLLQEKYLLENIPQKNISDEIHKILNTWQEDLDLSPPNKNQVTRIFLQAAVFQYYKEKDYPSIRRTLLQNIRMNPKLFTNRGAISIYMEAFLGPHIANRIRSLSS